jgi:hypothetical protein
MKRFKFALTAAVLALAAATAGTAVAKQQPAKVKKTNICHFTGKKYVAVTVSTKTAMQAHVQHHQDVIGAPVPQGTTKAKTAAARAFCARLPVLTVTSGGNPHAATLTSTTAGLSGSLATQARLGQGQICLKLSITSTTTPVTVSGIKILQATTTLASLELSTLSSLTSTTSPLQVSGCVNVNRSLVKQVIETSGLTIQVATSSPAGGLLTGTLS